MGFLCPETGHLRARKPEPQEQHRSDLRFCVPPTWGIVTRAPWSRPLIATA